MYRAIALLFSLFLTLVAFPVFGLSGSLLPPTHGRPTATPVDGTVTPVFNASEDANVMDLVIFTFIKYRDRLKGVQILLSRTQAGPGRTVKQEQEQTSRNHPQAF